MDETPEYGQEKLSITLKNRNTIADESTAPLNKLITKDFHSSNIFATYSTEMEQYWYIRFCRALRKNFGARSKNQFKENIFPWALFSPAFSYTLSFWGLKPGAAANCPLSPPQVQRFGPWFFEGEVSLVPYHEPCCNYKKYTLPEKWSVIGLCQPLTALEFQEKSNLACL